MGDKPEDTTPEEAAEESPVDLKDQLIERLKLELESLKAAQPAVDPSLVEKANLYDKFIADFTKAANEAPAQSAPEAPKVEVIDLATVDWTV